MAMARWVLPTPLGQPAADAPPAVAMWSAAPDPAAPAHRGDGGTGLGFSSGPQPAAAEPRQLELFEQQRQGRNFVRVLVSA